MDEPTRQQLLDVLPHAREELEKRPGDNSSLLGAFNELEQVLRSHRSPTETLDRVADEFLNVPRLLGGGITRRAVSTDDLPDKDEHPLAYLGNVIVKLAEAKT